MIGALWTGISGLAAHQTALDNESNNIANVNTVGYKAGRISFADQIYQGKIGKGSFVQDAEKIFVTGGSKITGVEYDVALQGDGFFTVINKNTLGTAETFYTRAGNFRMGQSGTLQNPDGYEVQGWAMSSIDQKNDVKSTNHNASRFTDAY
ncbi:MAG TPA: flagellar hook basal-body protein, partial [Aliarcobacter cryaerophilus]|nr:flagellar hook basal-body protein [Aliarcobacter cryaerophilus]